MRKAYLGDGVYIELDESGSIILTTEDGLNVTNRIVLEFDVYAALVRYTERQGWNAE